MGDCHRHVWNAFGMNSVMIAVAKTRTLCASSEVYAVGSASALGAWGIRGGEIQTCELQSLEAVAALDMRCPLEDEHKE
eukprot:6472886-Amphidinium_carterae.2